MNCPPLNPSKECEICGGAVFAKTVNDNETDEFYYIYTCRECGNKNVNEQ